MTDPHHRSRLGKANRALKKRGIPSPSLEQKEEVVRFFLAQGIDPVKHGSSFLARRIRLGGDEKIEPALKSPKPKANASNDHFGSPEAGAEAALKAGDEEYKKNWLDTVLSIVRRPDFVDMVSTDVTDIIGLPSGPPEHRSGLVAALTPLAARTVGLIAIGHRRSTDIRHKHILTIWGFPEGKNPYNHP
jgi:hypothetical protein